MNRIILIGNGFDLAHGLPTSYKDFINWYWNEWIEKLKVSHKSIEKDELCTYEIVQNPGYRECWQSLLKKLPSNFIHLKGYDTIEKLYKYNLSCKLVLCSLLRNICQSINTKGWVDIENEYYKLLKSLLKVSLRTEAISERAKTLNSELEHLKLKLTEYLTQIQDKYLTKDQNINPEIERLIFGHINENDISLEAKERTQLNKAVAIIDDLYGWRPNRIIILNFNYTKTAEIQK